MCISEDFLSVDVQGTEELRRPGIPEGMEQRPELMRSLPLCLPELFPKNYLMVILGFRPSPTML